MRIIALTAVAIISLLTAACDSNTAALARKDLLSRPLIHHPGSSDSSPQQADASK